MFFIDNPEYTKHGYYLVDDKFKTFSKYEAYTLSGKNWSNIKFIYNDDTYDKYDWTKEPEEDIYELYRQRAQQLREKYDYLVLVYSGGIDSSNIFDTFLNNGIKLDEVLSFSLVDTDSKTNTLNQEVFNRAYPYFEFTNAHKLGIKFRHVPIGQAIADQWSDEFHYENFHFFMFGPQWWSVARTYRLKSMIKDHMNLTEQGKKVCYIWGFEKPYIVNLGMGHSIRFPDVTLDLIGKHYTNNYILKGKFANFYDEAFYITGDFPKISIKQGHLLLKLIKSIPKDDDRLQVKEHMPNAGPWVEHHSRMTTNGQLQPLYLSKKLVDGCIYPKADLASFGFDKVQGSFIFSSRDNWLTKSSHNNSNRYEQQIRKLVKESPYYFSYAVKSNKYSHIEEFFVEDKFKNFIPDLPQFCVSKRYFLESKHD